MKKRVVIDGRMVTPVPHGFARYVARLCDGLRALAAESRELSYEPVFLTNSETQPGVFGTFRAERIQSGFLSPTELFEIPLVLKKLGADLYHSPTFSSLLYCPCPWVVTVHDLNHLTFGGIQEKLYYAFVLKRFARHARRLLTVSEFSRKEISDWTGVQESEIEVALNALDPGLFQPLSESELRGVLNRFGLEPGKYFFCLSNPKPHKNVPFLISAYGRARERETSLWPLVLSMTGFATGSGDGIIEIGGLGDQEVRALMVAAGALVFPSLYEGFGLPPVESAALGVPIIVSEIPPHQEALRDLQPDEARWLDPQDLDAWVGTLVEVGTRSAPVRPSAATMTRVRERYSVQRLGRHMDRVYRDVLGI